MAKVSKVLKSLRERGIIRLERIGKSNKIYLEKNFKNKACENISKNNTSLLRKLFQGIYIF
jgi:hypothetical protein